MLNAVGPVLETPPPKPRRRCGYDMAAPSSRADRKASREDFTPQAQFINARIRVQGLGFPHEP